MLVYIDLITTAQMFMSREDSNITNSQATSAMRAGSTGSSQAWRMGRRVSAACPLQGKYIAVYIFTSARAIEII
jgi:hypothetical protein